MVKRKVKHAKKEEKATVVKTATVIKKKDKKKKKKRLGRTKRRRLRNRGDDVNTTPLSKKQVRQYAWFIITACNRERKQCATLKLERNNIMAFWQISRKILTKYKANLRNMESRVEDTLEMNAIGLDRYRKKVNHIFYEHKDDFVNCKIQHLSTIKDAENDLRQRRRDLRKDKTWRMDRYNESVMYDKNRLKWLRLRYDSELNEMRKDYFERLKQMEQMYLNKYSKIRDELRARHTNEIKVLTDRKAKEIDAANKYKDFAFAKLKSYFSDIALNNWSLIARLKEKMEVLRTQNECISAALDEVTRESKRSYKGPLEKCQKQIAEYKVIFQHYKEDQILLSNRKIELKAMKEEVANFKWPYYALELRYEKLEAEKDDLQKKLFKAILETQQINAVKNALLDGRIAYLKDQTDVEECLIAELEVHDKKPQATNEEFKRIIREKNDTIRSLQYHLARARKAHYDLLLNYEAKLRKYKIPQVQLGFTPLRIFPRLIKKPGPSLTCVSHYV